MWSDLFTALRRKTVNVAALLIAAGAMSVFDAASPRAQDVRPVPIDSGALIAELSNSLAAGRMATADRLSRLGFAAPVAEITTVDGALVNAFSSQTLVETLYRRAEAAVPGDGDRLLAFIHRDASKTSAALAGAPEFAFTKQYKAEQLDKPFRFAALSAIADVSARPALSPAAEAAITKLSDVYAGPHLAQARGLMLRHFRKQGFDVRTFERLLAQSPNAREMWLAAIEMGTPPPRLEEALRAMLHDSRMRSAVAATDKVVIELMDQLSRELTPELDRYVANEDKIPSRQVQASEASKVDKPGKVAALTAQAEKLAIISGINRLPPHAGTSSDVGGGPGPAPGNPGTSSAGIGNTPPRPGPEPGPGTTTSPGGGGGGGGGGGNPFSPPGTSADRGRSGEAYNRYSTRTFEGPNAVPRSYRVAIRSARAARGIAIGGAVTDETGLRPIKATWMPNIKDERFGRLFVEMAPATPGGPPVLAVSRVMFADSFYSAISALWEDHGKEAKFNEGNLLIVMSMDPEHDLVPEERRRIAAQLKTEFERAVRENDTAKMLQLLAELEGAGRKLPRAIVVHPALTGRELAWSAARVDFWFNKIDALSSESALTNGGQTMPQAVRVEKIGADTWQFYERDFAIQLGAAEGSARKLVVKSGKSDTDGVRSHFAVSMFALAGKQPPNSERVEDGVYRLPALEQRIQPMLDWLATNHHDFMRLNDFSESFSILRWLGGKQVPVQVVNLAGQPLPIATPDRVVIGDGPKVK